MLFPPLFEGRPGPRQDALGDTGAVPAETPRRRRGAQPGAVPPGGAGRGAAAGRRCGPAVRPFDGPAVGGGARPWPVPGSGGGTRPRAQEPRREVARGVAAPAEAPAELGSPPEGVAPFRRGTVSPAAAPSPCSRRCGSGSAPSKTRPPRSSKLCSPNVNICRFGWFYVSTLRRPNDLSCL